MCAAGVVGASTAWHIHCMRYAAWLAGAGVLVVGCAGSGTTLLDSAPPTAGDALPSDVAVEPPRDAIVGPICPDCIASGGETSDFDGGRDPCAQFIRTIALTDTEATLAGFDVAANRQRLERSFEAPLRWTDLTSTSALPRSTPTIGYDPATTARGSITAQGIAETFFDTATCDAERQCQSLYGDSRLDCSHFVWAGAYRLAAHVVLTTDDGALDATLEGAVPLQPDGLLESATQGNPLTLSSSADIANVRGTLRIEPPPGINRGSISLHLALLDGAVRGRLEVSFTTRWRELPGVPLAPLDDQPLVAALQNDDCPFSVTPLPIGEPSHTLGGQTPADVLETLRSRIADTAPVGVWTHVGAVTPFDVDIESIHHACVAPIVELGTGAVLGRGQLLNLPIHLSSGDGLLDWPALATYQLGDATADLPHRLSFRQELTPASSRWHEAFGGFELARHTERILLGFGARYSVAGSDEPPASVVFEIFEQSGCPGNDPACQQEQADSYDAACLVAPPGGSCMP
jgi:hypothetical protein